MKRTATAATISVLTVLWPQVALAGEGGGDEFSDSSTNITLDSSSGDIGVGVGVGGTGASASRPGGAGEASGGAAGAGSGDAAGAAPAGVSSGVAAPPSILDTFLRMCELVPTGETRPAGGGVQQRWEYVCTESLGTAGLSVWLPQAADGSTDPLVFPRVTVADILPGAADAARARVPLPVVEFGNVDPEFGWAYVRVPVEFRVSNLGSVSASASAVSGPWSAWVTVTATPVEVRFIPGEPRGAPMSCSAAGAQAPVVADAAGECSHRYVDSSAVSANGRTFTTTVEVLWDLSYRSSEGPGVLPAMTMVSTAELAVAEVQALVTCTGARPEQGGCG